MAEIRGRATRGGLMIAVIVAAAACVSSTPDTSPSPATIPSSPSDPSVAPTSSLGDASVEPAASPSGTSVPFDDALLAFLPASVDGIALTPDPDTGATVGADPELIGVADGLAYAVAIDPAAEEFALASVVRFQPGVLDDAFFRDWRDSFDEGACSQAGGIGGHAAAEIGGRQTYIGSCEGGLLTYHVALVDEDVVVSVSSLGERRLGEQVIAGLRQ